MVAAVVCAIDVERGRVDALAILGETAPCTGGVRQTSDTCRTVDLLQSCIIELSCVSSNVVFKGQQVSIFGAKTDQSRIHASQIGIQGCIRRARSEQQFFYPGMTMKDIKEAVGRCAVCQTFHQS